MPVSGPDALDALERAMGHSFRDRPLLLQALTHASFANEAEDAEDNETLEFLGDSVLKFLVSEMLFDAFPQEGEGTLSKARSLLVSDEHFAKLARRLGLGPFLRVTPSKGPVEIRELDSALAGGFEAVIAAIYLDGGFEAVRSVSRRLFTDDIGGIDPASLTRRDPKTALQEQAHAEDVSLLYQLVDETGPDHDKWFVYEVVYGETFKARGEGSSKKEAQRKAADALLEVLAAR